MCLPLQMMEASLYDKIMDQQRLEPEFFRVGFYGKKFPFFLRVSNVLFNLPSHSQQVSPSGQRRRWWRLPFRRGNRMRRAPPVLACKPHPSLEGLVLSNFPRYPTTF